MDFDYTVNTKKDFDSAVSDIEDGIAKHGMRVLQVHNIQNALVDKGFTREPFKIIEFCSAGYANKLLDANIKIGLCLPCKINVYSSDGQVFISGMRPVFLREFFPEEDLDGIPEEVDQVVQDIIDKAK